MSGSSMQRFWDARATEDAYYFVDNLQSYGKPDRDRFWASGEDVVLNIERILGVTIAPTDELVEVGCGIGRITRALARRAAHVTAFDISGRMLQIARKENPAFENVDWVLGDGTSLSEAPDSTADAMLSYVVFHHIPDPRITMGYVREMGRVLRPGGWSAFQLSNDPEPHRPPTASERARGAVRAAIGRGPGGQTHDSWLGSYIDLEELRDAGRDAGLSIERVEGEGTVFCLVLMRRDA